MKFKILIIIIAISFCMQGAVAQTIPDRKVTAQPNVAVHVTKVLSVVVSNDSTTHIPNGTSYHNYFKATVASIGTGVVNYKWIITNSGPSAAPLVINGSLSLNGTGTDFIYLEKTSGRGPVFYKLSLQTETPNQVNSNICGYN